MGNYYKTTPWIIPSAFRQLEDLFTQHGKSFSFSKGDIIAGPLVSGEKIRLNQMIYLESGLLSQCFITHNPNKPKAMSLVLPSRVINYTGYMGFDTSSENLIALRNSQVYTMDIEAVRESAKKLGFEEQLKSYCMKCIASDFDAFTCMFTCETEKRLGFFFQSLIDSLSCNKDSDWALIPIKLSYGEISSVMYTTKKTIERIIPDWKQRGIIIFEDDSIKINIRSLQQILRQ